MATWKKIIVSGSTADLANVNVDSIVSASTISGSFVGDGSGLSGVAGTFPSTALAGTSFDAVKYFVNDGASKFVSGSQVAGYIFDKVSGDATVAAGGALTIANDAVQAGMLNDDIISGQAEMTGDVADTDELLVSDAGTVKRADFSVVRDAVFNDVSGDATIAAGGALTIANDSVEGTMLNTNVADASTIELSSDSLSVLKVPNALTAGGGLTAAGTFDGAATRTFAVDSGSLLPFISGSVFGTVSGDITITDAGVATIANNAVALGTDTTGNYVETLSAGTGIDISGADAEGATKTVAVDVSDFMTNGANNRVLTATGTDAQNAETNLTFDGSTLALTGDMTVSSNVTISGNLTVTGDTIENQVTNLAVEDKFILLNSGSSTNTDEAGIIFGGSTGAASSGSALIWNGDYNSNDGRLAIANAVGATDTSATISYYIGGVFDGTANDAATAQADHRGNIRVDSSDDIYIYV
jgi:hypothetical protein